MSRCRNKRLAPRLRNRGAGPGRIGVAGCITGGTRYPANVPDPSGIRDCMRVYGVG